MVTAVPGSQRRNTVTQEPALPAVHEGVVVTAFAAASDSSEVRFWQLSSQNRTSVAEYCTCVLVSHCRVISVLYHNFRFAMDWRLTKVEGLIWRTLSQQS